MTYLRKRKSCRTRTTWISKSGYPTLRDVAPWRLLLTRRGNDIQSVYIESKENVKTRKNFLQAVFSSAAAVTRIVDGFLYSSDFILGRIEFDQTEKRSPKCNTRGSIYCYLFDCGYFRHHIVFLHYLPYSLYWTCLA